MDIGAGILAGGQGIAGGLNKLGDLWRDEREKAAFIEMLARSNMQQAPIAQMQQPMPQQVFQQQPVAPPAQQNPGNAQTSQLGALTSPENRAISQGLASEFGNKWAQQPGAIGGAIPSLAGLSAPRGMEGGSSPQQYAQAPQRSMNGALPQSLYGSESGGNYRAQNNAQGAGGLTGHFGRAQFGQARLAEAAAAGAIPQGTTPQAFMASPELQQRAEAWHVQDINQFIAQNGLDRAIGQQINGVPVTLPGMQAVAHLGGKGGLKRFIETGGQYNPADANGTSLMAYLAQHGGGQAQTNPLARVQPLQSGGAPQQAPQQGQPMTLAQLSQPTGQPQFDMQTLGAMMTNKYGAPLAQQILAKQLGRDPIQQQMQMIELQRAQQGLANSPVQQQMLAEQLRAAQLGNQRTQAEISGEGVATTPDMKEFALAKRQGFGGTFLDYQQAKSAAKQKPGISAADQKVIFAEEDQLPVLDGTIQTLQRAKELNSQTFTGTGAGLRATIGTSIPGGGYVVDENKAKATREFGQIMSMEAIKSMSSLLKGATTDKEMMEFQKLLSDPTTPPDIRARTIDRMLTLAQRQKDIATGRINELRAKAGQQPITQGGAAQKQPPQQQVQDPLGIR